MSVALWSFEKLDYKIFLMETIEFEEVMVQGEIWSNVTEGLYGDSFCWHFPLVMEFDEVMESIEPFEKW